MAAMKKNGLLPPDRLQSFTSFRPFLCHPFLLKPYEKKPAAKSFSRAKVAAPPARHDSAAAGPSSASTLRSRREIQVTDSSDEATAEATNVHQTAVSPKPQ